MSKNSFTPFAATQSRNSAAVSFLAQVLREHLKFGEQVGASLNRLTTSAFTAKIPEDVVEAAVREHQGLVAHAFEAARAQVRASGDLARGHYAGLVQAKVLPCSLLQSSSVEKAVNKVQSASLQAVDSLEALRKKVLDPLGLPSTAIPVK